MSLLVCLCATDGLVLATDSGATFGDPRGVTGGYLALALRVLYTWVFTPKRRGRCMHLHTGGFRWT